MTTEQAEAADVGGVGDDDASATGLARADAVARADALGLLDSTQSPG